MVYSYKEKVHVSVLEILKYGEKFHRDKNILDKLYSVPTN